MKILGIDLAGKPENPTVIAISNHNELKLCTVYEDEELLDKIGNIMPDLIVIDAPLSLPKGRCCLNKECSCSEIGGNFRAAEIEIRKYGRVLPLTFYGMRMLTERGIKLANQLKGKYEVLETHPRTIQKILGFQELYNDLNRYFNLPEKATDHELDAVLNVILGIFYMKNKFIRLGDPEEGIIILPDPKTDLKTLLDP